MTRRLCATALLAVALSGCGTKQEETLTPPADALKTPSGILSKVLRVGLGSVHPTPRSSVTVHYTGWTLDGKIFDGTSGKPPLTFALDRVIPGWTEGLQLMVIGEKRRFWIPANLAYGDNPGSGDPTGMLVFDIELLNIQ
jgi:peptidylprolyl isomerase